MMKLCFLTHKYAHKIVVTIFITLLSVSAQAANHQLTNQQIQAIIDSPDRPSEDAQRDAARRPQKVLGFSGVASGDTVLDLLGGSGWYTELFSKAVGNEGKVYLQNDDVYWKFAEKEIEKRTADNRLQNVVRLDNVAIADIDVADNSVDIVIIALAYHDLFFTETARDGKIVKIRDDVVDHHKALANIKRILKDEGSVIVIDHNALAGSGYNAANTLHRIDANIVKHQFTEAGFTLIEQALYLQNPEDDLKVMVFDPSIRGKTDRFIYKFSK